MRYISRQCLLAPTLVTMRLPKKLNPATATYAYTYYVHDLHKILRTHVHAQAHAYEIFILMSVCMSLWIPATFIDCIDIDIDSDSNVGVSILFLI